MEVIAADSKENPLQPVDYRDENAAELFVKQLKETGFGVLKNHPITPEEVKAIYDNWYKFFTSEEKHKYTYNMGTQDGYFPPNISETAKGYDKKDIKEYFHFYLWGQCPPELKEQIVNYQQKANAFAEELLGWIEKFTPKEVSEKFSIPLCKMIENSEQTLLRILHYPPQTGNEEQGAIRAQAHEDINLITILPAANEPGLQVLTKDNKWIDVPCDFGNIIINNGDMLQEATGGYFPSTTHRVINPIGDHVSKSRISLPLFLHPRPDVVLSEKYTQKSYLRERLLELGVITEDK